MKRRSFLSLLSAAPVAAPIAAKEAVSGMAVTSAQEGFGNAAPPIRPRDHAFDALREKVSNFRMERDCFVEQAVPFSHMKSWSESFRHSEARKQWVQNERSRRALEKILYGDMSIAEKTLRLAALGVKV